MQETLKRGMGFQSSETNSSTKGNNYLLAIGIGDYLHLPRLPHVKKDTQDLIQILSEKYQFQLPQIHSIFDHQGTKENIINGFKSLVEKTKSSDNVIIYFSGQGNYDETFEEGYWMPVDAKLGNESNFIPNSYIKKMLAAIDCHHLFVMVDSCFSDSLFNRGAGRVANRLERDPSRWGLTSGKKSIIEGDAAEYNSPFAESILYLLKNNLKSLGVAELCSKVIEVTAANSQNIPIGEPLNVNGHRGGQLMFHPKVDEAADWALALSNNTIASFQAFLVIHPSGKNAALARGMIFDLETKSEWAKIMDMKEGTEREVVEKLEAFSDFIKKYETAPQLNEALKKGEYLECKKDFLSARSSIFKLKLFAQRETPFQDDAKRLIESFEEDSIVASNLDTSFPLPSSIQNPTSPPPISNTPPITSQPEYINHSPPPRKNNLRNILIISLSLAVIFAIGGTLVYQYFFKKNTSELPLNLIADPSTGSMIIRLEEGTPPYGITILRNDVLKTKFDHEEQGDINISEHFDEEGEYELQVEDAEKRFASKLYTIDHEWNSIARKKLIPPSLKAKTDENEITVTIEKGNPPYQLRLMREDKSIFEKTISEAGVHTIDISEVGKVVGNYIVTIEDAEQQTEDQEITIVKKSSPPQFQFDKKSHDFGVIEEGKKVSHIFEFTNIGSEPLKLLKSRPSSRSVTCRFFEKTILSGEKGKIEVTFNSRKRSGKEVKSVKIFSNSNSKNIFLTIKARVKKKVKPIVQTPPREISSERESSISNPRSFNSTPPEVTSKGEFAKMIFGQKTIDFEKGITGEIIEKKIIFYNTSSTELKIENVTTSCRCLVAKSNAKNIPANGRGEIQFRLDLKQMEGLKNFKINIVANTSPTKNVLTVKGEVLKQQQPASPPSYPHLTDERDGKFYRIVKLKDGKYWMAENLNFEIAGSWCYNNSSSNCKKYGRLYSFQAAAKACPSGWHLPTIEEWDQLFKSYGGYPLINKKSDGTEAYEALFKGGGSGFRADLGGIRDNSRKKFLLRKEMAYFWSSDKINGLKRAYVFYQKSIQVQDTASDSAVSCRCVKD